jgi:hypothetical protein
MKNFIKKWLERLETANQDNFGSKPLDCCTVGRDKKSNKEIKLNSANKK